MELDVAIREGCVFLSQRSGGFRIWETLNTSLHKGDLFDVWGRMYTLPVMITMLAILICLWRYGLTD